MQGGHGEDGGEGPASRTLAGAELPQAVGTQTFAVHRTGHGLHPEQAALLQKSGVGHRLHDNAPARQARGQQGNHAPVMAAAGQPNPLRQITEPSGRNLPQPHVTTTKRRPQIRNAVAAAVLQHPSQPLPPQHILTG